MEEISQQKCCSDDINNVFDRIAFTEQQFADVGYQEGFKSGLFEGELDGFHLGYHRGAELGAEIGYYKGVAETVKALHEIRKCLVSEKAYVTLVKLIDLIGRFPKLNVENVDFTVLLDEIRSLFRRACSLLKLSGLYPETSKLTF